MCWQLSIGLAIITSWVQFSLGQLVLRSNVRQVVHTNVPLLPSSLTWYWSKSGDALRLGKVWRKLMSAYRQGDDLKVTCKLTACILGSAPGLTLGNKYGRTLPFTFICK